MKKLLAIVVALTMVLALSVSVFAVEGSVDVLLVVQEQGSWQTTTSAPVTINAPGVYTFNISGLSFDGANLTVLYIKDKAAYDDDSFTGPSSISDVTIYTKSIKINGEAVALTDGYLTGVNDNGVLDICWHNIWADNFMPTPSGTVTDIEVVIEVVNEGEAPSAAPVEDGTAADNNTVTPEAPAASNDAPAAAPSAAPSAAPAAAPNTGIALAVVPAVMALAAVAVSKKR